jgi:hypothetical protein
VEVQLEELDERPLTCTPQSEGELIVLLPLPLVVPLQTAGQTQPPPQREIAVLGDSNDWHSKMRMLTNPNCSNNSNPGKKISLQKTVNEIYTPQCGIVP